MKDEMWKDLNWGMIILLLLNAFYWVSVWCYGFFIPTIVTIVGAAVVGIIYKIKENNNVI